MTTTTQSPTASPVSERLAEHVLGLQYDDIPDAVIAKAKDHIAHLVGTAIRGQRLAGGQRAIRLAHELSGTEDGCTIVGASRRVRPLDAIFANAFLITWAELDDYLLSQGAHPGVVVQPVAWAFGEATNASGRDLLVAIVVGYDVLGAVCDPMLTWGQDPFLPATFVFEPFAAVATAARLLGLSREQAVRSFGHAARVSRHRTEADRTTSSIHALLARDSGMAALLAKADIPASSSVFEGDSGVFRTYFSCDMPDSVAARLATLGRSFAIADARVKRPAASHDDTIPRHPVVIPVELARRIAEDHALSVDQIAKIDITLPDARRGREAPREQTVLGPGAAGLIRRQSLSFKIATVLCDGRFDPARFEGLPDTGFLTLLDKIRLRYEPGHPLLYARVEISCTDGQRYAATDNGVTSEPPLQDWTDWLTESAEPGLAPGQITNLTNQDWTEGAGSSVSQRQLTDFIDLIRNLEHITNVSDLMSCLAPDRET